MRWLRSCFAASCVFMTPALANAEEQPATYAPSAYENDMTESGLAYQALHLQIEGGYGITEGPQKTAFRNGWTAGLGLTWFPVAVLPIGLRVDGSYSRFGATDAELLGESQTAGTEVASGRQELYGADADLELDMTMSAQVKQYLVGGYGTYRQQTVFEHASYMPGTNCLFFCVPGYIRTDSVVSAKTSPWVGSWNAGVGFEFSGLQSRTSFFIEARYMRLAPFSSHSGYVPVRVGFRY